MNELLMEPLEYYENSGRSKHEQYAREHFDKLLSESGVDVEANRQTVKELNLEYETIQKISSKISRYKTLRVVLIIAIIALVALAIAGINSFSYDALKGALFVLLAIAGIVPSLLFILKKINPSIKNNDMLKEEHTNKANVLLDLAKKQVAPLLNLFDDTDTFNIIEKTMPDFSFDRYFNNETKQNLVLNHDFVDLLDDESSTVNTMSGRYAGNPFLFCQRLVHEMRTATYHGQLVIHWQETYRDSQGKLSTRSRSQTLHASVVKPKPEYFTHTSLGYGCQVAPDLTFDRAPQHSERKSDKKLERIVKSGERKLGNKARKATASGGTFQEMANSEFDVLFGATNRDNEVQFRLMYTPLAQQNTLALLKNANGYGDDFHFIKANRYNIIVSEHSQGWNMSTSPVNYHSHDIDEIQQKFIGFNTNYFRSVFFDFAPLLSIPAYVERPTATLDPVEDYDSNYTYYAHELMANAVGREAFKHPESATEAILKTQVLEKKGKADVVSVTAYSYTAIQRVDFIPVLGGDGKYHNVPVNWTEYIPVSQITTMSVEATDMSEKQFYNCAVSDSSLSENTYFQGMLARVLY